MNLFMLGSGSQHFDRFPSDRFGVLIVMDVPASSSSLLLETGRQVLSDASSRVSVA